MIAFYEITLEPETFLKLTDKLIGRCGRSIRWTSDFSGVDTVVIRDAQKTTDLTNPPKPHFELEHIETPLFGDVYESEDRMEYEPEQFWGIYRRLADEFINVFGDVDLMALPFATPNHIREFGKDVWTSFFDCETQHFISQDRNFALLVIKSISYPDDYLEIMNQIDEILISRYGIKTSISA